MAGHNTGSYNLSLKMTLFEPLKDVTMQFTSIKRLLHHYSFGINVRFVNAYIHPLTHFFVYEAFVNRYIRQCTFLSANADTRR